MPSSFLNRALLTISKNFGLQLRGFHLGSLHNACKSAQTKLSPDCDRLYQDAINTSLDDPNITAADASNKGFAYLALDNKAFSWSALQCFQKAKTLAEIERKIPEYKEAIECGIRGAKSNKESNQICYHVLRP